MRILIIGGGSIGKRHARNINTIGEHELGIVEVHAQRATALREEFKCQVFENIPDAVSTFSPEIMFICSPSIFHLEHMKIATLAGCHFFVEKPVAHTTEGVTEIIDHARTKKLITMVGSNWKFYPLFKIMKELIDQKTIGRILSVRCQFGQYLPDWHPWEDYRLGYSAQKKLGGGVLLDSHEFDYLTWFMGPVKKIVTFADKISNLEIDVEDVAETLITFQSGAIGEIHLDYVQRFYQRTYEFFGETGTITWDVNEKKVVVKKIDTTVKEYELEPGYEVNTMYVEQLTHFLDAVKNKTTPITSLETGQKIISLIQAAKISATESRVITM